ncbi:Subtilisin-like protease SBT1.8-like protein [Drosera capensis]
MPSTTVSAAAATTFLLLLLQIATARKTYIVHVDNDLKPSAFSTHREWYTASLRSLSSTTNEEAEAASVLYAYDSSYPGFAASLSDTEAASLGLSEHVLGVYEDVLYHLHTTRTPEFLGLEMSEQLWDSHSSRDVIIGVLDTGVWPESRSFHDSGMTPVPSRWKGTCETGPDFKPSACNRKLIGARVFNKGIRAMMMSKAENEVEIEIDSPRDNDGHGTHTASTAAGALVRNVSLFGYAGGTARGMATKARVAAYKVCWAEGCSGADILAGMDAAISDGVDVMSLSLGGGSTPFYRDPVAIGGFAAMQRGIFVACSAGNSGPLEETVSNTAPWLMTVGAGTLDRTFPAYAVLGLKDRFTGVSLYSGKGMGTKPVPLVYGSKSNVTSNLCLPGSLDPAWVRGKVVLCDRGQNARVEKGEVVRRAGGVGMILANTEENGGEEMVADSHLIPAVAVGAKVGNEIREYVKKAAEKATAVLSFVGTVLNVRPSPVVASFSSRGPNAVVPEILKPDLIGPGVNILAAWTGDAGPSGLKIDSRRTEYNILSGTSMSCPHISGLAALLKAAHPDWSPSAIKSALMTTSYTHDNSRAPLHDAATNTPSTPWAHGAGHVNLQKAMSPGLVYDITPDDYAAFLCSLNYTGLKIAMVTKFAHFNCTRKLSNPGDLNYPSFSVVFGKSRTVTYERELTNVGSRMVYRAIVDAPPLVGVKVTPDRLIFRTVGEKKKYIVTFELKKGNSPSSEKAAFGSIIWGNREHQVRSPVSITWP